MPFLLYELFTQTALLLGDAYSSIQEPGKAMEVYETAQTGGNAGQ